MQLKQIQITKHINVLLNEEIVYITSTSFTF